MEIRLTKEELKKMLVKHITIGGIYLSSEQIEIDHAYNDQGFLGLRIKTKEEQKR